MTAHEYLARLNESLGGMNGAEREDFLREMESHIAELRARRPGEGEDAIVSGLTPPDTLAAELLWAEVPPDTEDADSARNLRSPRSGQGSQRPAERLRDILESFARRAERGDEDAEDGKDGELRRDLPADGIREIRVELLAADLEIQPSADEAIHLRVEGLVRDTQLSVEGEEGRLSIVERGGFRQGLDSVELRIPSGIESIDLSLLSGDIELSGLSCDISARSKSGDLDARGCSGSLLAETASGDLSLADCGAASAVTASGDIEAEEIGGDFAAKSASGSISIAAVSGRAGCETASGGIEARGIGGLFAAKTVSGEVSLDCGASFKGAILSTVSGDISVSLPEGADAVLSLSTRTGEIEVGGREAPRGESVIGSGGPRLEVSSLSGDIEIEC